MISSLSLDCMSYNETPALITHDINKMNIEPIKNLTLFIRDNSTNLFVLLIHCRI